jgi:hypothetical protein
MCKSALTEQIFDSWSELSHRSPLVQEQLRGWSEAGPGIFYLYGDGARKKLLNGSLKEDDVERQRNANK